MDDGVSVSTSEEPREPSTGRTGGLTAVGGPLFLAEACYLQDELKKHGVNGKLRSDRTLGTRRDAIHTVMVDRSVLEKALGVRERILLDETQPQEEMLEELSAKKKTGLRRSLFLGFLGAITGMRVGRHLHGSVWLSILLPVLLASVAFWAGRAWSSRDA